MTVAALSFHAKFNQKKQKEKVPMILFHLYTCSLNPEAQDSILETLAVSLSKTLTKTPNQVKPTCL